MGRTPLSDETRITYTIHGALAPEIRNPGALTGAEYSNNATETWPLLIARKAGKSYTHVMHGIRLEHEIGQNRWDITAHQTLRSLENHILNSIIGIERHSAGLRSAYRRNLGPFRVLISADAARQTDIRRNWQNLNGDKGDRTIYQKETLAAFGVAGIVEFRMGDFGVNGGIRADYLDFEVDDRLGAGTGNDASGSRNMQAVSPQFGVTYQLEFVTFFGGWSTSFESPTTTELANRPDGGRGFNPGLNPERATGVDFGLRGYLPDARLRFEVTRFLVNVEDRISGFQQPGAGDRTFFENLGKSRHAGVELALQWNTQQRFGGWLAATHQNLKFASNESGHQNNRIPGIPGERVTGGVHIRAGKMLGQLEIQYHGPMYADNANTVRIDAWTTADLNISAEFESAASSLSPLKWQPFLRARNLTNRQYIGSVTVNAIGNRYFEPAMPFNLLAGIAVEF